MNFLHFTTNLLPIVTMIVLEPIGFVHNTCTTSQAPEVIKKEISEITGFKDEEIENLKKEILDKELIEKYFYMLNFTYNLSNKLINIM